MTDSDGATGAGAWTLCNNAAIRRAARRLGQLYDDVLAPSGLRGSQFGLLAQIARADEPTMGALADLMVMDLSALGHTLKPLVRDGLVELVPNPRDRRSKRVRLTGQGAAKLAEATRLWREAQRRFEAALGPAEAAAMREALGRVASPDFAAAFTSAGGEPG